MLSFGLEEYRVLGVPPEMRHGVTAMATTRQYLQSTRALSIRARLSLLLLPRLKNSKNSPPVTLHTDLRRRTSRLLSETLLRQYPTRRKFPNTISVENFHFYSSDTSVYASKCLRWILDISVSREFGIGRKKK